MSTLDESLLSLEKLDRTSPELWPEPIPGVSGYAYMNSASTPNNTTQPWDLPLNKDDLELLSYCGSLSAKDLIAEVKKLHDVAYRLGLEEAKEMTRGKYLNILEKRKNR